LEEHKGAILKAKGNGKWGLDSIKLRLLNYRKFVADILYILTTVREEDLSVNLTATHCANG